MTRRALCFGCGEFLKAGTACRSCKNMTTNKPSDVRVVSVDLLEEIISNLSFCGARHKLTEILAQPADQQGEPVAWLNEATGHVTTSSVVVMDWDDEKEPVQSLYRHAQPATAKVDERAEFDRWTVSEGRVLGYTGWNRDFAVWQARAKLSDVSKVVLP